MDFPHNRDGFSGPANQHANWLAGQDAPFLRADTKDAKVSKKGEGFTYVEVTEDGYTAWSDVRRLVDARPYPPSTLVTGATVGIENKRVSGVTPVSTVRLKYDEFTTSGVQNFGDGRAGLSFLRLTDQLNAPDAYGTWGRAQSVYKVALRVVGASADAALPTAITALAPAVQMGNDAYSRLNPLYVAGKVTVLGPDNKYRSQHEFAMIGSNETGRTFPQFARVWKGGSDVQSVGTIGPRQTLRPLMVRLSPQVRLMMRRYVFGTVLGDGVGGTVDRAVPAAFSISLNAGTTWTDFSLPTFDNSIADVTNQANSVTLDSTRLTPMLNMMLGTAMQAAMLPSGRTLLVLTVPFFDPNGQWAPLVIEEDVIALTVNSLTGAIYTATILYDSRTNSGYVKDGHGPGADGGGQALIHQVLPVKGGAIITLLNPPLDASGNVNVTMPRTVVFTSDGVNFQQLAFMPVPAYQCGRITGADQKTLLCPMYRNGAYRLYRSGDRGVTWSSIGVLSKKTAAPGTDRLEMQNFNAVVPVKDADGQPMGYSPAAPWATDVRVGVPAS